MAEKCGCGRELCGCDLERLRARCVVMSLEGFGGDDGLDAVC
jgi:hypothetical protein